MTYKNYTPHAILYDSGRGTEEFPSEGTARVMEEYYRPEDGIPVISYIRTIGLPDPEPETLIIVSRVVAEQNSHRKDLVFPWLLVRDDKGRVIGCREFARAEERISFPTAMLPRIYQYLSQDSADAPFAEVLGLLGKWERESNGI